MNFNGTLLQFSNGAYTFPTKYIKADTYKAYSIMQDLEPWTDADGYLHRDAVELKTLKVEFETVPMMTGTEFADLMAGISAQFVSAKAKSLLITAYIPDRDEYMTQYGYMADIQPTMYGIFNNVIRYDPIKFSFIGGVKING